MAKSEVEKSALVTAFIKEHGHVPGAKDDPILSQFIQNIIPNERFRDIKAQVAHFKAELILTELEALSPGFREDVYLRRERGVTWDQHYEEALSLTLQGKEFKEDITLRNWFNNNLHKHRHQTMAEDRIGRFEHLVATIKRVRQSYGVKWIEKYYTALLVHMEVYGHLPDVQSKRAKEKNLVKAMKWLEQARLQKKSLTPENQQKLAKLASMEEFRTIADVLKPGSLIKPQHQEHIEALRQQQARRSSNGFA